ncbi:MULTISPECIES: ComEA family DNA-binding protein [Catenuloplanes]|uniref:DNA uptake protein ComE-like DNA-binding protein n=1 Tax=Catenuloplanes niger TaxID=587534 RepID=A0AAE3ZKR0_9ACTN|nr:helix-hairpin-helix domain-containing protein [Catenuloplanes niger]MDR7321739.1 DNA uptake protein ComE-like DNA-binding protein [Catenuloplanes niger]
MPALPAASSPAADDQLVLPPMPPGTRPPTFVDRVDVNAATADELTVLPGLTPAGVARAVDLRELGGPFTGVDEFFTAAGVDPADQPRLLNLLACHPPHRPYDRSAPYVPATRILDV